MFCFYFSNPNPDRIWKINDFTEGICRYFKFDFAMINFRQSDPLSGEASPLYFTKELEYNFNEICNVRLTHNCQIFSSNFFSPILKNAEIENSLLHFFFCQKNCLIWEKKCTMVQNFWKNFFAFFEHAKWK